MSRRNQTIEHRERKIRKVGLQYHAFVDKVERSYPDLQSAKDAIDEMLERWDQVERTVGALRSVPYADAKKQYFTELQAKGRSDATQKNYTTFFRQLEKVETLKHTKDITTELISKFLSKFKAQGTKHTNFMAVRGFVGFCLGRNYLVDRKILDLEISAGRPTNGKRAVSDEELVRCTKWMNDRKSDLKLLWRVGIETGLRTREAVTLLRKHFNADDKTITIDSSKTNKRRTLIISDELARDLKEHIATCESDYVVSRNGSRFTEQAIQSLVKRMRKELKLSRDVSFYSLRKRVSNHAYYLGGPALESNVMGHSAEVALSNYVQVKPEMGRQLLGMTAMSSGPSVPSSLNKESVEHFIGQMAKTDREWLKGVMMKAL